MTAGSREGSRGYGRDAGVQPTYGSAEVTRIQETSKTHDAQNNVTICEGQLEQQLVMAEKS